MVDFEQYPDTLTYGGKSVQCRFVPTRGNKLVKNQDGAETQVSFEIAFPLGTDPIPLFSVVTATDRSGYVFLYKKPLLAFHIGQFHCKGAV